jgi:hypothetical protein
MIFTLFPRFMVKLGNDEKYVFDRARIMYTEVVEIEKVTGLPYIDWDQQLGKFSITAVAALIHVLRKRAGVPSDFASMQFNVKDLDVMPVHDDGTEYTMDEVTTELRKRAEDGEAALAALPTQGADEASPGSLPTSAPSTPASSPSSSTYAPGNGTGSPTPTYSAASGTSTPS